MTQKLSVNARLKMQLQELQKQNSWFTCLFACALQKLGGSITIDKALVEEVKDKLFVSAETSDRSTVLSFFEEGKVIEAPKETPNLDPRLDEDVK